MSDTDPACRLYLITPPAIADLDVFCAQLEAALDAGDVACLQIRLKEVPDEVIKLAAEKIVPLAQAHDVAVLMNDRPDLALELGCDGVHVGQDDTPYKEARHLLGPDKIIGVTCHDSRDLAMEAGEAGADYVAFGAFFPTETKQAKTNPDPEILSIWSEMTTVPSVAIGGITVENAGTLIEAGADFLAVSAGVWQYEGGPAEAVRAFNAVIKAG